MSSSLKRASAHAAFMTCMLWIVGATALSSVLCERARAQDVVEGTRRHPFIIFDGTKYLAKPDMRAAGIEPIYIAYEGSLFREQRSRRPPDAMPEDKLLAAEAANARKMGSRFMVVDIEAWPVVRSGKHPREVADSIARYRQTVAQARRLAPDLQIGLFSPLPAHSGYERLIAPADSPLHAEMVADNDNLAGLAAAVDAIFPIGYTFSEDRDEWRRAVAKQVAEARRINPSAPVYVFLWPQYADYGPVPRELRWKWLPADYWRFQLETLHEIADGVVIWGGWDMEQNKRRQWDHRVPWWTVTLQFTRDKELARVPKRPTSLQ